MFAVKLKQFDWPLFISMVLMIGLGLILQYSLSLNAPQHEFSTFKRQLLFVFLLGFPMFFFISFSNYRAIRSFSYLFYFFTLLFLLAVLFLGETRRGVRGWFSLGPFTFQPVELAKIAVIIFLARFWQGAKKPLKFKHLSLSFLFILPAVSLIIFQPDLGSSIIIIIIGLGLAFMVNRRKKYILILIAILLVALTFSWFFLLKNYQKERILNFLNPQSDPFGRGYQRNQAIIAIGSGQLLGRGLSEGTQSQLHFLPEAKTDFIFAVLAEEFGFLGCLSFLGLYFFFLYRLLKISEQVYDNFALVLVLGVSLYFFSQMFINIGMNLGFLPVIGLSLPFLSYGGSSLIVSMLAVALVESVVVHQPPHQVGSLDRSRSVFSI